MEGADQLPLVTGDHLAKHHSYTERWFTWLSGKSPEFPTTWIMHATPNIYTQLPTEHPPLCTVFGMPRIAGSATRVLGGLSARRKNTFHTYLHLLRDFQLIS